MKRVSPQFCGYIDHSPRCPPVLGVKVARHYTKLLHRIQRDLLADGCRENVHVLHAVEKNFRSGAALPINGYANAAVCLILIKSACRAIATADVSRDLHEI